MQWCSGKIDIFVPQTNAVQHRTEQTLFMKKYAIIVAGGTGRRMGHAIPKQFLRLHDKPVLYYTLKNFLEAYDDLQIVLVFPEEYQDMGKEIIDAYFDYSRIQITFGGETRFHSVQNGLKLVKEEAIIFVHDAVRCLVTVDLIQRCYEHTLHMGSAVPVVRSKDSVRLLNEEGNDNEILDRTKVVLVQTPQTFHSKILLPAFEIDYKERFTDEATVVESFGLKISLIEGEENNIKITQPVDLLIAEALLTELEDSTP
jgi:2-C-methyl-D-erythritol 4-phosphate cytidylyltransferase